MDRQEHVPDQPAARLVDLPGRRLSPTSRSNPTRPGSISAEPARCASRRVRQERSSSRGCSTPRAACPISRSSSRVRFRSSTATPSRSTRTGAISARTSVRGISRRPPGVTAQPAWQPRGGLDGPKLLDLWRRSDDDLRALLKGSPMKRAGVTRLRRNLAVAIGNSGDAACGRGADEPSGTDVSRASGGRAHRLGGGEAWRLRSALRATAAQALLGREFKVSRRRGHIKGEAGRDEAVRGGSEEGGGDVAARERIGS